jgi:hypothetical protein
MQAEVAKTFEHTVGTSTKRLMVRAWTQPWKRDQREERRTETMPGAPQHLRSWEYLGGEDFEVTLCLSFLK